MMAPLLIALPGNEALTARLAAALGADIAAAEFRHFPDEESYVRIDTPVAGRSIALFCTLDRPDTKVLPLFFAAATLRELGAVRVGLVAPYLAYMRQDRRFKPGEAVTSSIFAKLLSGIVDWLVTIDPHLHRISALSSIYRIPARSLHAAPLLAGWIKEHVASPLLVGPDAESAQWVGEVAVLAEAPHIVLEKQRHGDRDVKISVPHVERWVGRTPVLVDDIVSTARTMIETLGHLKRAGMQPAVCIGVHAVFAPGAYDALRAAGPQRIVTTNAIPHETNAIDVTDMLAEAATGMVDQNAPPNGVPLQE
jgi:ribose-phosphate pyrophosphokinase